MNRRTEILEFIRGYQHTHGWSPSIAEIAEGVGLRSTATVHVHLHNLERDGAIERGPGPRQVRVVA